ncbi:MAG: hypothetical protein M3Z26_03640 [Bacteroidota bacterium]|nr:hypothetical protein [Bacteroidota bacterium]
MKNLLLIIFNSFSLFSFSQVNSAMPPEASLFYTDAMRSIKPATKTLIEKDARKLKNRSIDADSLTRELKSDNLFKDMTQHDIEGVAVLIMVQVSKNADTELKNLVMDRNKSNAQKPGRNYNDAEMILEYKSQIAEMITIAIKKISPSAESVINNLK